MVSNGEKCTCEVCGYQAKSAQGLTAHRRLKGCDKPSNGSNEKDSKYNGCMHNYRKLTDEELQFISPDGRTLKEAGFILVCEKCDKLF